MKTILPRSLANPVAFVCWLLIGGAVAFADEITELWVQAEKGDVKAQVALGGRYLLGIGVIRNEPEAVNWYRKAANRGEANAQFNLGNCYYNGKGVAKDLVEAVNWFRKAAEQGLAEAQNNLGARYSNGAGDARADCRGQEACCRVFREDQEEVSHQSFRKDNGIPL